MEADATFAMVALGAFALFMFVIFLGYITEEFRESFKWKKCYLCNHCNRVMIIVGDENSFGVDTRRWMCSGCGYIGYSANPSDFQSFIPSEYTNYRPGAVRRVLTMHGIEWITNEDI